MFFWVGLSNAAFVNRNTAQEVAKQFVRNEVHAELNLEFISDVTQGELPLLYIFTSKLPAAFVVVAADDIAHPILGYSFETEFSLENTPEHLWAWLGDYKKSILWGIEHNINATEDIKLEWDQYLNNKSIVGKRRGSVSPLLKAKWNQVPYYNDLCPLDGNKRSVVGCVATAMAQVIHHWQYPTKGSGFHSYSHSTLGTISANFGNTTYNYSNMPNSISSKNSDVALLNFHCGVAVEMNYSAQSSGAYVISAASPITHCAEYGLKKYFGYPSSVNGQLRDNYSTSSWKSKVNSDLDNGRPIIYAGFGNGGGHAFVFDGYDNTGKYHVNWGWGGAYNGYFEIDALNPDGLGTGGGTGSYNSGHQAIFGVEAPDNTQTTASLSIYANMSLSASRVSYGQPFSITTNAANVSGKDFAGSLAIAVFDDSFNFVEFVGEMSNQSLKDNYAFNSLTFKSNGSLSMLPGDYHLYLCYKNNGGEWKIANDYGSYTNYAPFEIFYHSDIELYSDLKVTTGTLRNGESATVKFNMANTGTTTFRGSYAIALYNMDGSFAQLIGTHNESNGLPTNNYYTSDLSVSTSSIDLEPGTYLLAAQYQRSGATNWTLVGSYYKVNPIKVIVEAALLKPDPYEVNNDVANAYVISPTYSNNMASWNTNITNIHQESDADFFKINFDNSYIYTLDIKLSDLNKSFNGNSYDLDARFSLSDDGVFWSSTYKNELAQSLKVNGKDKSYVLIRVVPAFAGLMGDYDLNISLTRESTASVSNVSNQLSVFPNPAQNQLQVKSSKSLSRTPYRIMNLNGSLVLSGELNERHSIQIDKLPAGLYLLNLELPDGVEHLQFIKE